MRLTILIALVLAILGAGCDEENQPTAAAPAPVTEVPALSATGDSQSRATRIMPLGDSITQGDTDHDTYRRPLWRTLESLGYGVDFVGSLTAHHRGPPPHSDFDIDHEGHWGWRVDEVLEHLRGWLAASKPDILLVHLGSNDVFQGQSTASTLAELRELIALTREVRPGASILLAQILPTDNTAANARIRELNSRITELSAPDVLVVNQFDGFDARAQTYDGVHPNPEGEIHLSDRWLEALQQMLPMKP